nr:uncharacterized protein LOC122271741 [Parasteatoda tepidariorum]
MTGDYQCGFRSQRSTIDQIHTLKQILEKTNKYNNKTFHSGLNRKGTLWNRSVQLLEYADVIGRSERAVREAFLAHETSATNIGLTINEDKTKFMESPATTVNHDPLFINDYTFEKVNEFKYLGTMINDQNSIKTEVDNRIKMANKCFFGLSKQLTSCLISRKIKIYKTLILPVLLYASETWTLNADTLRTLGAFERKILRNIFGPPQIVQVIRSNRLRWLGHIWRSPENNAVRIATFKNPSGSRTRGRPPTRWLDDITKDLKVIKINNWKKVAMEKRRWTLRVVEAARGCRAEEDLNSKLQGRNQLMSKLMGNVSGFRNKLKVFSISLNKNDLAHFPCCRKLSEVYEDKETLDFSEFTCKIQ